MKGTWIRATALALFFALGLAALAEPIDVIELNWTEASEQSFADAGYSGTWHTLDGVGCKLIIPDGYEQRELTGAEQESGVAFAFANAENGGEIDVLDNRIEDVDDLEGFAAMIREQDPDGPVQFIRLNGTASILSGNEEYDMAVAIFDLGDHRFVQVLFSPMSMDNQLLTACMASIQF